MRSLIPLVCCFLIISSFTFSQKEDSIRNLIRTAKHDTSRIAFTLKLGEHFYLKNTDSAEFYWNKALVLSSKSKHTKKEVKERITLLEAQAYNNLGAVLLRKGNNEDAIDYFIKSLKLKEEINDMVGIGKTANNIGYLLGNQGEIAAAKKYLYISLKARKEIKDSAGISQSFHNLGYIFQNEKKYTQALNYYRKSLKIREKLNLEHDIGNCLNNIGLIHFEKKNFDSAYVYYNRTIDIFKRTKDDYSLSLVYSNIAQIKNKKGQADSAFYYALNAYNIADKLKFPEALKTSSAILSDAYKVRGDFKNALKFYEVNTKMSDSLRNLDSEKAAIKAQLQYEKDKAAISFQKQHQIDQLQINRRAVESKANRMRIIGLSVGFVLLLGLLILVIKNLKQKQRTNELIQRQKQEIQLINEEINQSIDYAEMIQTAVLPKLAIQDLFPDAFILFKPKNVVSGDFFWMEKNDRYKIISACDCTGHGIPGAFISMIGTILLNEIYNSKKLIHPNEVLTELDRLIRLTLGQENENARLKDGMDIAYCVFDHLENTLYFSGANNPLWLIRNANSEEIVEIKGDKIPIGGDSETQKEFTLHSLPLEKGDAFFIFSDGYADQFGGEKGKKLLRANFKNLLLSIKDHDMTRQQQLIDDYFENWKSGYEQVDDVCVIGVRV